MDPQSGSGIDLLSSVGLGGALIALYESLVNVMFCVKDADLTYVEVNSAFVRRTGRRSKRDVIGRTASELFAAERAELYEAQDGLVLDEGSALRDELELIRRPDGQLGWYLTTKLPVQPESGQGVTPVGLVSVSRDLQTPTDEGVAVESLQPFVNYVRSNLHTPLRNADLAEVVGCSTDQLDRRVRRVFGLTPKQYVLRVKVERAMELLSESDASLSDVAHESGFYDQPDFSRRFARATGRTPAQFRSLGTEGLG